MKQPVSPIISIRRHTTGSRVDRAVIGIVRGRDWFPRDTQLVIYDTFFVVAEWHEYSDGRRITCEDKRSIAICRDLSIAQSIYATLS